jgi:hypothetical protein
LGLTTLGGCSRVVEELTCPVDPMVDTDTGTSGSVDSGGTDTGPPDSGDTGPPDTGDTDTGPPDTGDTDTGPAEVCPCSEGFEAAPADDVCVGLETSSSPRNIASDGTAICAASGSVINGQDGVLFPGGTSFLVTPLTPEGSDSEPPLNTVGIWSCDGDGQPYAEEADQVPFGAELGVAHCFEVEEPGSYLVGFAGDDSIKVRVDGVWDAGVEELAFTQWHLAWVDLSSGAHTVEAFASNIAKRGSLGVAIYGPFESQLADRDLMDQDLPALQIWSTESLHDVEGDTFSLDLEGGYDCPSGSALNECSDVPLEAECVTRTEAACL